MSGLSERASWQAVEYHQAPLMKGWPKGKVPRTKADWPRKKTSTNHQEAGQPRPDSKPIWPPLRLLGPQQSGHQRTRRRRCDLKTTRLKKRPKRKTLSFQCFKTLELLRSFSAATVKQIQREAFNDCSLSFVCRKMRDLEREKLIEKIPFGLGGRQRVAYTLATRGWGLFDFGEIHPRLGQKVGVSSLLHKLGLLDIRHAFERMEEVESYRPRPYYALDEDLEDFISLRPDALVKVNKGGKRLFFALEYFADFHCPEGTEAKIERYLGHEELDGAIFISHFRHVSNRLMALERKCEPGRCGIYHAQLEAVLNSKEMKFVNKDNPHFASFVIS